MHDLEAAVADLLLRPVQAPNRLNALAEHLIDSFARAGLPGLQGGSAREVGIRGLGRQKDWDLAYVLAGKPRLLISLKSILRNLAGTVPNRLDDLMGEAANVQQLSPEIVIGYVVIVDESDDRVRSRDGDTWAQYFDRLLGNIAIRRAPLWNQGLIEGAWLIRINRHRPDGQLLTDPAEAEARGQNFIRALLDELFLREPTLRR